MMKIPSRNKQTLLTFHDGTRYQDEKCLSSKETCHWDQNQLKTTNVQKHIELFPQDLCIIYDLVFEYKMHTNGIITLHIYYSNTSHVQERQEDAIPIKIKVFYSMQDSFPKKSALSRSMTFECKCTKMGSLLFPMQENTKQILSRAKRSKRYKEDK